MTEMPASAVAATYPAVERPPVRRFQLADLSQHGKWLIPRLLEAYPHLDQRNLAGWLNGALYSSEYLFTYAPHTAGMAQLIRAHTLEPKPVIWERFVFAEDRKDPDHLTECADFYDEMARWAKHHGAETIVVLQRSDASPEAIKDRVGRILTTQQSFVKVA
jgi:hypothetical protein